MLLMGGQLSSMISTLERAKNFLSGLANFTEVPGHGVGTSDV